MGGLICNSSAASSWVSAKWIYVWRLVSRVTQGWSLRALLSLWHCVCTLLKTGSGLVFHLGQRIPHRDQSCFPCRAAKKGPNHLTAFYIKVWHYLISCVWSLSRYTKPHCCHVFHELTFKKGDLRLDPVQVQGFFLLFFIWAFWAVQNEIMQGLQHLQTVHQRQSF